jgi:hypothetical protein
MAKSPDPPSLTRADVGAFRHVEVAMRKLKHLLRARRSGPAVIIEAVVPGPTPHYRPCLDELLEKHGDEIQEGAARGCHYAIHVVHDVWCPGLKGGICNCDCVVKLIETHSPEDN